MTRLGTYKDFATLVEQTHFEDLLSRLASDHGAHDTVSLRIMGRRLHYQ